MKLFETFQNNSETKIRWWVVVPVAGGRVATLAQVMSEFLINFNCFLEFQNSRRTIIISRNRHYSIFAILLLNGGGIGALIQHPAHRDLLSKILSPATGGIL